MSSPAVRDRGVTSARGRPPDGATSTRSMSARPATSRTALATSAFASSLGVHGDNINQVGIPGNMAAFMAAQAANMKRAVSVGVLAKRPSLKPTPSLSGGSTMRPASSMAALSRGAGLPTASGTRLSVYKPSTASAMASPSGKPRLDSEVVGRGTPAQKGAVPPHLMRSASGPAITSNGLVQLYARLNLSPPPKKNPYLPSAHVNSALHGPVGVSPSSRPNTSGALLGMYGVSASMQVDAAAPANAARSPRRSTASSSGGVRGVSSSPTRATTAPASRMPTAPFSFPAPNNSKDKRLSGLRVETSQLKDVQQRIDTMKTVLPSSPGPAPQRHKSPAKGSGLSAAGHAPAAISNSSSMPALPRTPVMPLGRYGGVGPVDAPPSGTPTQPPGSSTKQEGRPAAGVLDGIAPSLRPHSAMQSLPAYTNPYLAAMDASNLGSPGAAQGLTSALHSRPVSAAVRDKSTPLTSLLSGLHATHQYSPMKAISSRPGPVTPTMAASDAFKHVPANEDARAKHQPQRAEEPTFLTKEGDQVPNLVWKKGVAEPVRATTPASKVAGASEPPSSATASTAAGDKDRGAAAEAPNAGALSSSTAPGTADPKARAPAELNERLPQLKRMSISADSSRAGTQPAKHGELSKRESDEAAAAAVVETTTPILSAPPTKPPVVPAPAPVGGSHASTASVEKGDKADAPASSADAEAQRKALQREREMHARAKLKEFVACVDFDGRATVDFYGFGKVLGTGSFGEVRLAWHRLAGVKVAVKSYEKSRITDPSQWKRVQQEIEVLQKLNHLHVLRMFESIDTAKRIHIVTDFCSGGNLCSYVKSKGRLHEVEARKIFVQLVAAVDYLHQQGIIHRDIKLENVLFVDERQSEVKLVDFGFAVIVTDQWRRLKVFCGTPSYMAPEICQRREYHGRPVDVWSLGVLLYAMLVGRFPFSGKTYPDLYKKIVAGQINYPEHMSSAAKDLVRRMLTVDHTRRIALQSVITHPWVVSALPGATGSGFVSPPVVSSNPPIMAPNTSILVSADPANDMNEAVLQRCEQLGFRRTQLVPSILGRVRDACSTTYYLLLARMGRNAKAIASAALPSRGAAAHADGKLGTPDLTPSSDGLPAFHSTPSRRAQSAAPAARKASRGSHDPRGDSTAEWPRLDALEVAGGRGMGEEDEPMGEDFRTPSRAAGRTGHEMSGYLGHSVAGVDGAVHSQAAIETLMSKDAVLLPKSARSVELPEAGPELSLTLPKADGVKPASRRAMSALPSRRKMET